MGFKTDPTARRRWDRDAQLQRDQKIMQLFREALPQREIARSLGVSLGTVQHCIRREKRAQAPLPALPTIDALPGDLPGNLDLSDPSTIRLLRDYAEELADCMHPERETLFRYRLRYVKQLPAREAW